MPELFRMYGFLFMFFSHEHEPMHVHVIGNEGEAKYSWDGKQFVLERARNMKTNDLRLSVKKNCQEIFCSNNPFI